MSTNSEWGGNKTCKLLVRKIATVVSKAFRKGAFRKGKKTYFPFTQGRKSLPEGR